MMYCGLISVLIFSNFLFYYKNNVKTVATVAEKARKNLLMYVKQIQHIPHTEMITVNIVVFTS